MKRSRISIFLGDITEATADVLCTSTNPRLSLMMGTGAAVRERGGSEIARACEAIVAAHAPLPAGSVWMTTAGRLPYQAIIHCVAGDAKHRSSLAIVRACTRNALRIANESGYHSVALPLFATGHAHLPFADVLQTMGEEIESSLVAEVVIVTNDASKADLARGIAQRFSGGEVLLNRSTRVEAEPASFWDD